MSERRWVGARSVVPGFADRLRAEITEQGYTIIEFCRMCKFHKGTLYGWLNEVSSPKICQLAVMCEVLGCSADYLMFGE